MQVDWNPDQKALRGEFEAFGRREVAPRAQRMGGENAFDHESWEKLCATGIWKMIIPGAHGGTGEGWWDFTAALEGLARTACDGGFVLTAISQAAFIRGLHIFGTPEQQERYFPMLLRGALTATAIAEPHSGTDATGVKTQATRKGGGLVLNGEKYNIAHAPTAELLLVVGRMPDLGKRDLTLFLLDPSHGEIQRGAAQSKMGNRTIPTSWLRFQDLRIAKENSLGEPGKGLRVLSQIASLARIYYGLMGGQLLKPVLDEALKHIRERESFKRPLSEHQYVQRKITEVVIGMAQSRWTGLGALGQLLSGDREAFMNSSVAKIVGTEAFLNNARELMGLFGSNGYLDGLAAHLYKDASGWITVGGTEEMHRINVFNQLMRLHEKD